MDKSFNMATIGRKIGELINEHFDKFSWLGADVDGIEKINVIIQDTYKGRGTYDFCGEIRIVKDMPDNSYSSRPGIIKGKVYIEEGKEPSLSDIEQTINIQLR